MSQSLTHREINLMRTSFESIITDIGATITVFYKHLFEIDPSLRAMFKDDVESQGGKLMAMLVTIITSYDRLDSVQTEMEELGELHVDFSVRPEQFEPVGEALIRTFEERLGGKFTPEVRAIWGRVYDRISEMAIAGIHKLDANEDS